MTNELTAHQTALVKALNFSPSDEQWAAISAPLEPGVIIAGAGTGKTSVMAARVGWLVLNDQIQPDQVLGLTFTNKATDELATRIRRLLIALGRQSEMGEPTISTYNAFAAALMREHGLRIGYEPSADVVVDAALFQLAARVVRGTAVNLGVNWNSVPAVVTDLLKFDGNCSNYLADPEEIVAIETARIDSLNAEPKPQKITYEMLETAQKRRLLAELVCEFRVAKKEAGVLDYNDQVRLAVSVAEQSPALGTQFRAQFPVVLLDEYQDTSVSQQRLLHCLFGGGHPVLAVGDPCQAIYGWRGAEVSNIDRFPQQFTKKDGAPANAFRLTENHRSAPEILAAANELSSELRAAHPNVGVLRAAADNPANGVVATEVFETFQQEVDFIADEVTKCAPNWSDVAVLVRERKQLADLISALRLRNVPLYLAEPAVLIEVPEVRSVVSLLELIDNPAANAALVQLLSGDRWRIGTRDLAALGRRARKLAALPDENVPRPLAQALDLVAAAADSAGVVCLLDALDDLGDLGAFSAQAVARFHEVAQLLDYLRRHAGEPLSDLVYRISKVTGLAAEAQLLGSTLLAQFVDLAASFRSLDGHTDLAAFLAYLKAGDSYGSQSTVEPERIPDAVTLMTIHKAKGLEYGTVFVPGVVAQAFPNDRLKEFWTTTATSLPYEVLPPAQQAWQSAFMAGPPTSKSLQNVRAAAKEALMMNERRLAYVAFTRPQLRLVATAHIWGPTQKETRGPSDFLQRLHASATHPGKLLSKEDFAKPSPVLANATYSVWPQPYDNSTLKQQAQLVAQAGSVQASEHPELVAIDADIALLRAQLIDPGPIVVRLPEVLSTTALIALQRDPQGFASNLARPMPQPYSFVANRGTDFHAWVEQFYGAVPLLTIDELPGGADGQEFLAGDISKFQSVFQASQFATRFPAEIEHPFTLRIGSRTINGRIDAVFAGSATDPKATGQWFVVDWKTGSKADPLQLEVYRHAWAQHIGCDPAAVSAGFFYVGSGELQLSDKPMPLAELAELLEPRL